MRRLALLAGLILLALFLQPLASAQAASTTSADIGMPFAGKWAYNAPVSPPYTDSNSSHPSVHAISGGADWATDLYGASGQEVRLRVASSGALSFSWKATTTSCGTSTGVNVLVNGQVVGWIYVAHLVGAVQSGPISNGMLLGRVGNYSCAPGNHVHVEMRSDPGNYSCYQDLGRPGTAVADGQKIGALGATGARAARTACSTTPPPAGGGQVAFNAASGTLWTVGVAGNKDWQLGVMPGTSPSITAVDGGYQVAFHAASGSLWTVGAAGNRDWGLGLAAGTSPSITRVPGGFQVAFQANGGSLWTAGTLGSKDWRLGMRSGTNPSITAVPNGFEVAVQTNTGALWTVGDAGSKDWQLGLKDGTNPSITAVSGGYQVAFHAASGSLWTVGAAGNRDWQLGLRSSTSPSISS